jgi:hypothetical protein
MQSTPATPNLLRPSPSEQSHTLQVPLDGSLELLALGDIGLIAWRAANGFLFNPLPTPSATPDRESTDTYA